MADPRAQANRTSLAARSEAPQASCISVAPRSEAAQAGRVSLAPRSGERVGVRGRYFPAILGAAIVLSVAWPSRAAEHADKADKGDKNAKTTGAGGASVEATAASKTGKTGASDAASTQGAGGAPATAAAAKRTGPPLLRTARPKAPPAPPPAVKPGEDGPPPSPLTMDALRQDMKRGRESGGISPDAPARTKVEQMLVEMAKTRAALRDDTSRLENLTVDGLSAGDAGAPGVPAAPGAPGQPAQKNPLDVLAKALRGIKPAEAAPIVARIDRRLAATVLLRMPPVDAGKIMGALKPDVAAEIATEIAMRAKPQHPLVGMGAKR